MADVIHVGCLVHMSRKTGKVRQALPKGKQTATAEQGVAC